MREPPGHEEWQSAAIVAKDGLRPSAGTHGPGTSFGRPGLPGQLDQPGQLGYHWAGHLDHLGTSAGYALEAPGDPSSRGRSQEVYRGRSW